MHRYLRKGILLLIPLLLVVFGLSFGESPGTDPLWQKAVEIAGKNTNWIPGSMVIKNYVLEDNGNVKKAEEITMKVYLDESNQLKSDMVKYLENGVDVTERKKNDIEQAQRRNRSTNQGQGMVVGFDNLIPFMPGEQTNISLSNTGRKVTYENREFIIYDYKRIMIRGERQIGRAWLDSVTGIPLKIVYTVDPLPQYVFRITNEVVFQTGRKGGWYPERLTVDGSGGFILFKMNMNSTTFFSDFWNQDKVKKK